MSEHTACSSVWRSKGLATTRSAPSAPAVEPSQRTPGRNCPEIATIGTPGYAARRAHLVGTPLSWHENVDHDRADGRRSRRLVARGTRHGVAFRREPFGHERAHERVVLEDCNPCHCRTCRAGDRPHPIRSLNRMAAVIGFRVDTRAITTGTIASSAQHFHGHVEHVARTALGLDVLRLRGIRLDLAAQAKDLDIDRPIVDLGSIEA